MQAILALIPLKPGKLEAYRAFTAQNTGPRKQEYIDLLKRYGLKNVQANYHKLGDKEFILVMHDAEKDAMQRLAGFNTSTHPYDQWFAQQLADLHNFDEEIYTQPLFRLEYEKEAVAEGSSWVCPCLTVKDLHKSIAFYQDVFGFQLTKKLEDETGECFAVEMLYKDILLMLGQENKCGWQTQTPCNTQATCPLILYLYCEDVDAMYQKALQHGAKNVYEPENAFWGDRACQIKDPDGYIWGLGTNFGDLDNSKMQEFWQRHPREK